MSVPGTLLLPVYLLSTVLVGSLSSRAAKRGNALTASRSLPLPLVVIAYLAANCGALEVMGMAAVGAQYGVQAFHFYWLGAIPAMVFLSLWMMPVYRRSGIRTLPEYLSLRFGTTMRTVNATTLAITLPLLAGVSLYALAQVLLTMLDVPYSLGVLLTVGVALAYVLLGGVRANMYNEVLQLAVVLAGLVPVAWRSLPIAAPALHSQHLWRDLPFVRPAAPVDALGVSMGLGFVLAFNYWCTDFVLMQRALTARTESAARQVPLWAAFGKLVLGFLFIVPGLAAPRVFASLGTQQRLDRALPLMMRHLYGPTLLGLGLTALCASLLSGLAANITAAATVFTEDLYRIHLRPGSSEGHYRTVGRWAATAAALLSLLASATTFLFRDLMEQLQVLFSVTGSPAFAVFLLGMTSRRANSRGALAGFVAGALAGLANVVAVHFGLVHYGSTLAQSFYGAMLTFTVAAGVCLALRGPAVQPDRSELVYRWHLSVRHDWKLIAASVVVLFLCAALNLWMR